MKGLGIKLIIIGLLAATTLVTYGASFRGWFLPERLNKPISLRDGSERARRYGLGYYFIGRSHYGGGYRGGK